MKRFFHRFLFVLASAIILASPSSAQVIFETGFEDNSQDINWKFLHSNSSTNRWYIGDVVSSTGTRSLYIGGTSNTTNSYYNYTSYYSWAYIPVTLPANFVGKLSFSWHCKGYSDNSNNHIRVYIGPNIPTNNDGTPSGATLLTTLNQSSDWQTFNGYFNLVGKTAGTYYLMFQSRATRTTLENPAPAIDDITLEQVNPLIVRTGELSDIKNNQECLIVMEDGNNGSYHYCVSADNSYVKAKSFNKFEECFNNNEIWNIEQINTDQYVFYNAYNQYWYGYSSSSSWNSLELQPRENASYFNIIPDGTGHYYILSWYTSYSQKYYSYITYKGGGSNLNYSPEKLSTDLTYRKNQYIDRRNCASGDVAWSIYIPLYDRTTFVLNEHSLWLDNSNDNLVLPQLTSQGEDITVAAKWPQVKADVVSALIGWNTSTDGSGINYYEQQYLDGKNYFFPTYEFLYAQTVDLAKFTVQEWKQNSLIIKYTDAAATAETKISYEPIVNNVYMGGKYGKVVSNTLSATTVKLDAGLYELQVNPGDLMANAGNTLIVTFKDANGTVISVNSVKIPVIIPAASVTSNAYADKIGTATDIVLLGGAIFTLDQEITCNSIKVGAGAKLVVPTGINLKVKSGLFLQGGTLENGLYKFLYPQVIANGGITQNGGNVTINYDYYINNSQYYTLCLPYDVNTADIKYADGTKATFGIQMYNGEQRATGGTGWVDFEAATAEHTRTLEAGKGYTIFAMPQRVTPVGESRQYQKYAYLRLPMSADLSAGEAALGSSKVVAVDSHDAAKANDAGWNLVGNPYLANYAKGVNGLSNSNGIGLLEDLGNGYEWTGTARYVVVPNDNGTYYSAVQADFASLPAFKNFFIQIGEGDYALSFSLANRVQKSPARIQEESRETTTGISLSGNNATDKMGVLIGNYTAAYEINADLQKWANQGLNVYAVSQAAGGNLAFIAIDEATAQQAIKVGYTAPAAGSYTFAFDGEAYDATALEHLYLTDYQLNRTVDLLLGDYTFSTAAGTNDNRFAIACIHRAPGSATDLDAAHGNEAYATSEGHELRLHNLPMGADMFIYDVNGRLVESATCTSAYASFALPMGVYQVRVAGENEQVIRAIVR